MRRNRRHRVGSRRGSVSMRRCVATSTGWTMITTAIRRHLVARSPATVVDTVRVHSKPLQCPRRRRRIRIRHQVRMQPNNRTVNVQSTKASANQRSQRKSMIFIWSPLYFQCPAIQAIRKGAPNGSATTATLPPWRSIRGSTSTRPPSATTFAVILTVSSTRM
jgi:hypothetical protein